MISEYSNNRIADPISKPYWTVKMSSKTCGLKDGLFTTDG